MAAFLFYVSGHGWGHAARVGALLRELRRRLPYGRFHVRSSAPEWLFTEEDPAITVSPADIDVGMIQSNGLDIDLDRSLAAHEAFCSRWQRLLDRETRFIASMEPAWVIADIPPLPLAAAARAGARSAALGNFGWDWILKRYAPREPRWKPVIERYRDAYATAGELFRLPLHGEGFDAFRRVTDVPLLVRRASLPRDAALRGAGIAPGERRKIVLISFGGWDHLPTDWENGDALEGIVFLGFGPRPRGFKGDWIALPARPGVPHVDLLAACDAVITKPGYGIVSEVLAHRKRGLFLPRENFEETPVLADALRRLGCARWISREDFYAGRWKSHLDNLFSSRQRWEDVPTNGAEAIASKLLE